METWNINVATANARLGATVDEIEGKKATKTQTALRFFHSPNGVPSVKVKRGTNTMSEGEPPPDNIRRRRWFADNGPKLATPHEPQRALGTHMPLGEVVPCFFAGDTNQKKVHKEVSIT
uniref:Uncharacterized protein n=1 Tax=Panagrellus redivivus TaxID=6233 RepID=A0A7E4V5K0_PANRE